MTAEGLKPAPCLEPLVEMGAMNPVYLFGKPMPAAGFHASWQRTPNWHAFTRSLRKDAP